MHARKVKHELHFSTGSAAAFWAVAGIRGTLRRPARSRCTVENEFLALTTFESGYIGSLSFTMRGGVYDLSVVARPIGQKLSGCRAVKLVGTGRFFVQRQKPDRLRTALSLAIALGQIRVLYSFFQHAFHMLLMLACCSTCAEKAAHSRCTVETELLAYTTF